MGEKSAAKANAGGGWLKMAVVSAVAGGAGYAYWAHRESLPTVDLTAIMASAVEVIEAQGPVWGPVYYMLFLAVWVTLLLPCSVLEMIPGFLFGFRTGWIASVFGKNLGTVMSLTIAYSSRGVMRDRLVGKYPKLLAMEKAVKAEGFPVLVMIRLMFMPMLLKNYGLGSLDIPVVQIWLASLIASVPFATLWTAVGASASNVQDIFDGKVSAADVLPDNLAVLAPVAVVAGGAFLLAFRNFAKRFQQILKDAEKEAAEKAE